MSFIFYGFISDNEGLNITSRQVYDAPVYDVTAIEVVGRSGDLLIPQNRFKNKKIVYKGFLKASDFSGSTDWERLSNASQNLKGRLLRDPGEYKSLRDDYDPGMERMAYVEDIKITPIFDRPVGAEVEIIFNAQPFMYVRETTPTVLESGSVTLMNPYFFDSLPLLELEMSDSLASFSVNGETWTILNQVSRTVYCDAQEMEWYAERNGEFEGLINNKVSGPTPFPTFKGKPSPNNVITIGGGISRILISPRWRTL